VTDNGSPGLSDSQSFAVYVISTPPPSILDPPDSQTAEWGASVRLRVRYISQPAAGCRWFFNGGAAAGGVASGTDLLLTNLQFAQSGSYVAVITNTFGAVTSSPALVNVIAPVARRLVPWLTLNGQLGTWLNLDYAGQVGSGRSWTALDTVLLTNQAQWYYDLSEPLPSQRFYRGWQTNGVPSSSRLDLGMVPALTLTGSVGQSVRVDYINRLGPTNAWGTLDTVTLGGASQLYFDHSARGEPERLYRLTPLP
jgi:hypothetical protein